MTQEMKHLYNLVHQLIMVQAHMSDNYQRMMQGEIPFKGKREFHDLLNEMYSNMQEIEGLTGNKTE